MFWLYFIFIGNQRNEEYEGYTSHGGNKEGNTEEDHAETARYAETEDMY